MRTVQLELLSAAGTAPFLTSAVVVEVVNRLSLSPQVAHCTVSGTILAKRTLLQFHVHCKDFDFFCFINNKMTFPNKK